MLLTESHRVQGPGEHASMDLAYPLAVGQRERVLRKDGVDPQERSHAEETCCKTKAYCFFRGGFVVGALLMVLCCVLIGGGLGIRIGLFS